MAGWVQAPFLHPVMLGGGVPVPGPVFDAGNMAVE